MHLPLVLPEGWTGMTPNYAGNFAFAAGKSSFVTFALLGYPSINNVRRSADVVFLNKGPHKAVLFLFIDGKVVDFPLIRCASPCDSKRRSGVARLHYLNVKSRYSSVKPSYSADGMRPDHTAAIGHIPRGRAYKGLVWSTVSHPG